MPRNVLLYELKELTNKECKNEIFLNTKENTMLHIIAESDKTIIKFPFGNKFDIINGMIIIYEK